MKRLRNYFFTGLLVLLPILVSVAMIEWIVTFVDNFFLAKIVYIAFGIREIPGLGFLITMLLILIVGAVGSNLIGNRILGTADRIFSRIPVFSPLYRTVKQIVSAFTMKDRPAFQKTVLVEFPRKGLRQLGFITGETGAESLGAGSGGFVNVFVPTVPNPTTGFLLLVPEEEITPLDMPVEDAVKMIISAGIVTPADSNQVKNGKE